MAPHSGVDREPRRRQTTAASRRGPARQRCRDRSPFASQRPHRPVARWGRSAPRRPPSRRGPARPRTGGPGARPGAVAEGPGGPLAYKIGIRPWYTANAHRAVAYHLSRNLDGTRIRGSRHSLRWASAGTGRQAALKARFSTPESNSQIVVLATQHPPFQQDRNNPPLGTI